ncbi:MAG: AEC family transporter [Desulfobulbaceae bacterium]|nr:AEC family transporter [Desulfobulbaceae bacterium]
MLTILAITGPIFALIGLGFVCVRMGLFQRGDMRILGSFVINIALPALIVSALSRRTPAEILRGDYLLACAGGALLAFSLTLLWFFYVRGCSFQESAVTAMGSSLSNSAYMGMPIVVQVVGPVASVALALNMVVENILILPLALVLADMAGGQRQRSALTRLRDVASSLAKNPIILSIFLGLSLATLQVPLPKVLEKPVDMLALAAAPVALFSIGGNLAGSKLGGMVSDVSQLLSAKLLLHPLLVGLIALSIPGMDVQMQAAAILYSSMPMFSIYPLFCVKYSMEVFCSAAVVAATLASFITISVAIWLVQNLLLPSAVLP